VAACVWSDVTLNILHLVAVWQLIFIYFCLCVIVSSAIIFSYVRECHVTVYIGRENDAVFTCLFAGLGNCLALRMELGFVFVVRLVAQ
jgi:uncharacterized membrane protein YeiH